MSEIKGIITSYRLKNYGNLVVSEDPSLNNDKTEWVSNLYSRYPRIITNDYETSSRELYFIRLDNLGSIHVNNEGKIIHSTPRELVIDRISNNLSIWNRKVEDAILKACSSTLVFSPVVKTALNPLRRIIGTLLLTGSISNQEIKWLPNTERGYQWIFLLKTSKFIESYENGYKYGDMWSEFLKRSTKIIIDEKDDYHFIFKTNLQSFNRNSIMEHLIMSYMLEENFSYIQDVMNLVHMNTVINLNNSFYRPCLESGKLLTLKPETVQNYYNHYYPEQKFVRLSSSIMDLISIGLLDLRNDKLHGNEERFEKMLELRPSRRVSVPL